MARNDKGKNAATARRHEVGKLIGTGATERDMATQLGVAKTTIHEDILIVFAEWKKERYASMAEYVEREARKLDQLELEARFYWQQERKRAQLATRDSEPKWFEAICRVMMQRCKLLGLDAPAKIEHSGVVHVQEMHREAARLAELTGVPAEEILETAAKLANGVN
jgi:hypothetical protein